MSLKRVLSVVTFDADAVSAVAEEAEQLDAYLVLLAVSLVVGGLVTGFPAFFELANAVPASAWGLAGFFLVFTTFMFVASVVSVWVSAFIYDLVASWLGGSAQRSQLFRALAFAAPVSLLTYLPRVGWLVYAWILALDVFIIRTVEGVSTARALGTVGIVVGFFVVLILMLVFLAIGGAVLSGLPAGQL